MSLLEFEIEMLDKVLEEDSLLVTSAGLPLYRHLFELMKNFIENDNFVVITGTEPEEERLLLLMFSRYCDVAPSKQPAIVNSDCSMSERKRIYFKGGVVFVTGRILVVDLLTNRIPINQINGLIIWNAHRMDESCQNSFICRLFRMQNRNAFIKAFSGHPCAVVAGNNKIEQILRQLFLKRLSLWPRFHALVNESLENRSKPEVIEVRLPFTQFMNQIQHSLMQLIAMLLREVSKTNLAFLSDVEDLTPENIITFNLNEYYAIHFYPIWHQLDSRTKKNLQDIRMLKNLLFSLTSDDCVTFFKLVDSIRQSMKLDSRLSDWVFWNPAETLFTASKQRLYNIRKVQASTHVQESEQELFDEHEESNQQIEPQLSQDGDSQATADQALQLEMNLKWKSFCEIVDEIKNGIKFDDENINIFVIVENDRTIEKLLQVLDFGPEATLKDIYLKGKMALQKIHEMIDDEKEDSGSQVNNGEDNAMASPGSSVYTQVLSRTDEASKQQKDITLNIHFHCFRDGQMAMELKLDEIRPWYVICYDYTIACIRTLEIYQAIRCSPEKCKVYLLIYDNSAEEQRYFTSLKKERLAFERLISFKSSMTAPTDREGTKEINADLVRGHPDTEILVNKAIWEASHANEPGFLCDLCSQYFDISEQHSKSNDNEDQPAEETAKNPEVDKSQLIGAKACIACKQITRRQVVRQKVIVDMREFRSALPSYIHKRGIDLIPATIEIGDYVLTPEICVERKSISDLTQSLQSGRLFSQCKMMTRYYRKCIILIEFDESKSFNMKGKYWRSERNDSGVLSEYNLISKLILLSIHFPQIKFIWSPTPQFSGELIEELKVGREQPDLNQTMKITENELAPEVHEDRYDLRIKDFLLHLPGINLSNVHTLMNSVETIYDLIKMSRDDLIAILDNEHNATQLYQALHKKVALFCINDEIKAKKKRIFTKIDPKTKK